jgi:hypothetical protein
VSKKIKKPIKSRKPEKITEKTKQKKNRLKFWKNWPVQFGFISKKPNRTEPKPKKTGKKPSKPKKPSQTGKNWAKTEKPSQTGKTEPNRFEPVFALKNRTEPKPVGLTRFQFFFKKISVWLLFFIKTKPNRTENDQP